MHSTQHPSSALPGRIGLRSIRTAGGPPVGMHHFNATATDSLSPWLSNLGSNDVQRGPLIQLAGRPGSSGIIRPFRQDWSSSTREENETRGRTTAVRISSSSGLRIGSTRPMWAKLSDDRDGCPEQLHPLQVSRNIRMQCPCNRSGTDAAPRRVLNSRDAISAEQEHHPEKIIGEAHGRRRHSACIALSAATSSFRLESRSNQVNLGHRGVDVQWARDPCSATLRYHSLHEAGLKELIAAT